MKRIEFISLEDFNKLYKAEKDREMRLILQLGFWSGMRISEIIGLHEKISNCCKVAPRMEKVLVGNRNLKRYFCSKCEKPLSFKDLRYGGEGWEISPLTADKVDLKGNKIIIDEAKGDKWRITVPPSELTNADLRLLPIKIPMRTAQHRFKQLSMKALGKHTSIHILRHGFGNYNVNVLGQSLPTVQALMGHSRVDTTGIYTKANPQEAINSVLEARKKAMQT